MECKRKVFSDDIRWGTLLLILLLSCGGWCEEAPNRHSRDEQKTALLSSGKSVAKIQHKTSLTWESWCKQEQQGLESEAPLCAMYFVRNRDEPIVEMFNKDWNIETADGRSRFSEALKRKQSTWKRIGLTMAVWPDGKTVWSREITHGKKSYEMATIDKTQVSTLIQSLKELDLFRQPLAETRHIYVDVGYWVIEINHDPHVIHMESWQRTPEPTEGNGDFRRFCAVWKCVLGWTEQARSELQRRDKRVNTERNTPINSGTDQPKP